MVEVEIDRVLQFKRIRRSVADAVIAVQYLEDAVALRFMQEVAACLAEAFRSGNKLLLAGNGGSLCDAMHFAEELTGQFRKRRQALPAIALSEPGHLTCTANDMGYNEVFARGVEAFGKPGDVFIGLTTSGNSPNIIRAFEQAKSQKMVTVAFLGKEGGKLKGVADYELIIPQFITSDRIQEAHMAAIHIIIEALEMELFE